jgi:hypothetical protein
MGKLLLGQVNDVKGPGVHCGADRVAPLIARASHHGDENSEEDHVGPGGSGHAGGGRVTGEYVAHGGKLTLDFTRVGTDFDGKLTPGAASTIAKPPPDQILMLPAPIGR